MSDELVIISPKTLGEAQELAKTLATARILPEALQKSPGDILATVMAGAELGLAPMQALRGIVIIKGKPTLSADAMGALVKSKRDVCKYLRLVESTDKRAEYETLREGEPQPTRMAFTIGDAQRAQLTGDNWRKYPAAMLRARALSALCRAVYPDLLLGVYDPDELEAPRPERTVEPTPPAAEAKPATNAPRLKAQIREALKDDKVVDAPPPSPPKPSEMTPWEKCIAIGKERGLTEVETGKAVVEATGKRKQADLVDADVFLVAKHLSAASEQAANPL